MRSDRLLWGVKASLRAYIEGTGGAFQPSGGATRVGEEVGFPAIADRPGAFRGTIRILAHGGMLDWTISNPEIDRTIGVLSVEDARGERIALAALGRDGLPPTLTKAGAVFFEGMYEPGAELDPVRFD